MKHAWVVASLAVLLASPAMADELIPRSLTGGYSDPGYDGWFPGFLVKPAVPGSAQGGRFGAEFCGESLIESFTITQFNGTPANPGNLGLYNTLVSVDIYKDGTLYYKGLQLNAPSVVDGKYAPITVNCEEVFGEKIHATWLTFVVTNIRRGSGTDNCGVQVSYTGTTLTTQDNLNFGRDVVPIGFLPSATDSYGTSVSTDGKVVVDGNLFGAYYKDAMYYSVNNSTSERSFRVDYGDDLVVVESVGIALIGDGYSFRDMPQWVIISGGTFDSQGGLVQTSASKILMSDVLIQYNRYVLADGESVGEYDKDFAGIEWLKISFPTGRINNGTDWWFGNDWNCGLAEFQAFGYIIPEPATMSLLALGGLAMLRRRRK